MALASDDTQTIQIRRTILNSIEEMGIYPDHTYIRW